MSPFLDKTALRPLPLPLVSLLRTRLFSALIVLLLLGGFSHEVWGRIVEHDHGIEATTGADGHRDSDSGSDEKGCNHQGCHHGYPMTVVFADLTCLGGVVEIGCLAIPAVWAPDAIPQGIEHPPQIA